MKNFRYLLCALAICISSVAAQSNVTGAIPQYAGGIVTATAGSIANHASINAQGNFTIPTQSNPTQYVMTFTPPGNTPYQPFNLTVTSGPGTTNITAQIQAVVPQIGINLGILNASAVATNANGNAIAGSGGGGAVSSVFGRTGAVIAVANDYSADQIASGTVTGHGWVCGAGCVWTATNGGFNNANELVGSPVTAMTGSGSTAVLSISPTIAGDATSTPTLWNQVTSTASGSTAGLSSGGSCSIQHVFSSGVNYNAIAFCATISGAIGVYISTAHALGSESFTQLGSITTAGWSSNGTMVGTNIRSGETVVTPSATPTLSINTQSNVLTMNANVTSFTLAAGETGQSMDICFYQGASAFTVAFPANVDAITVGPTINTHSCGHWAYSTTKTKWLLIGSALATTN